MRPPPCGGPTGCAPPAACRPSAPPAAAPGQPPAMAGRHFRSLRGEDRRGGMNILILGGGTMQLPAARLARKKGWQVFVAARSIDPAVRGLAPEAPERDLPG